MDPRWLPWCWAAGAAGCMVVFFWIQPWRAEFRRGWDLVRKYPAAWAVPAGLLLVDALGAAWAGRMPRFPQESAWRWTASALLQGGHGVAFGPAAALLAGVLLAGNAAGLRRGFLKGAESVAGPAGRGLPWLVFLGMLALPADGLLAHRGVPVVWHMAVSALAVPLVGWVAAAVLAGWLLLAETEGRAPDKAGGVRWLESAAAHAARLWPWAVAHGVLWWLGKWLPELALAWVQVAVGLAGLVLAFAPLLFLHVKQTHDVRKGLADSLALWLKKGWQAAVWLGVAGMGFYLWFLAGKGLDAASLDAPGWLRTGLAALHRLVHLGLTVMGLGAWVALRLTDAPAPRRPRRAKSP